MIPGGYGRRRRHRGMGQCWQTSPRQPKLTVEEEARMLEEEEMMLKQGIDDLDEVIADLRKNEEKEVNK